MKNYIEITKRLINESLPSHRLKHVSKRRDYHTQSFLLKEGSMDSFLKFKKTLGNASHLFDPRDELEFFFNFCEVYDDYFDFIDSDQIEEDMRNYYRLYRIEDPARLFLNALGAMYLKSDRLIDENSVSIKLKNESYANALVESVLNILNQELFDAILNGEEDEEGDELFMQLTNFLQEEIFDKFNYALVFELDDDMFYVEGEYEGDPDFEFFAEAVDRQIDQNHKNAQFSMVKAGLDLYDPNSITTTVEAFQNKHEEASKLLSNCIGWASLPSQMVRRFAEIVEQKFPKRLRSWRLQDSISESYDLDRDEARSLTAFHKKLHHEGLVNYYNPHRDTYRFFNFIEQYHDMFDPSDEEENMKNYYRLYQVEDPMLLVLECISNQISKYFYRGTKVVDGELIAKLEPEAPSLEFAEAIIQVINPDLFNNIASDNDPLAGNLYFELIDFVKDFVLRRFDYSLNYDSSEDTIYVEGEFAGDMNFEFLADDVENEIDQLHKNQLSMSKGDLDVYSPRSIDSFMRSFMRRHSEAREFLYQALSRTISKTSIIKQAAEIIAEKIPGLVTWKPKDLRESYDLDRLRKMADLGDDAAQAELDKQTKRRGTVSYEEIVRRIINKHGGELTPHQVPQVNADDFSQTVSGLKTTFAMNGEEYRVDLRTWGDQWLFAIAKAVPYSSGSGNFFQRILLEQINAKDWEDAFEQALVAIKTR